MHRPRSLSINISANVVNQVSAALFPLITFPYVSRVLNPEGLGRVNFAEAVVSYFAMIATLGVPVYGIRESAKRRDDKAALSMLSAELFLLNTIMTGVALAAFGAFMAFSREGRSDPALFCICALPLLAVPIGFNWLFGGMEEYVYITLRTLCVRILVLIAVFVFVHTREDFRIYALIAALNIASVAVNVFFVGKYISPRLVDWKRLDVWRHLRPTLLVFSLAGVVGIYTSLNKVMLGYMTNDAEVGLYSAADRVVKALVMLVTSVGVVLLPRASYYIELDRLSEYRRLMTTAIRFVFFVSFPVAAGLIASAGPLMLLLSGRAFEPSIPLVQIMALNVLLIAVGNFMGYQVLYSQGKEKLLLRSVLFGAAVSLALNWLLIPRWHAIGAAVSTLIAELCVTSVQIIQSRAYSHFTWPVRDMLKYGATAASMGVAVWLSRCFVVETAWRLLVSVAVGAGFYLSVMWFLEDSMLLAIWKRLTAGAAMVRKTSGAEI